MTSSARPSTQRLQCRARLAPRRWHRRSDAGRRQYAARGLEDLGRSLARAAAMRRSSLLPVAPAKRRQKRDAAACGLGSLGPTHASAASYNNHWGVPLSLASLPQDARYAVFEIGMNHFGEIRSLVGFVRPHVALVTTIAPAHLEFFGTCDAIADAKSEIFESIEPGGTALIPSDSPYAGRLIRARKAIGMSRAVLTFGEKAGSDARLLGYEESERRRAYQSRCRRPSGRILARCRRPSYREQCAGCAACGRGAGR